MTEQFETVGDLNWNLEDTEMYFNMSADSSGYSIGDDQYVLFNTENGTTVPNSVKKITQFYWAWRVVAVGGTPRSPYVMGSTNHVFYTVKATPISPMIEPWTDVLDRSCIWANGQTTDSGIISTITSNLYSNSGGIYSPDPETSHSNDSGVYLQTLLNDLDDDNPDNNYMDCRDYAHFLNVLTATLGVDCRYRKITPEFTTNYLYPSGWPSPDHSIHWNFHQISWFNTDSKVNDAATKIDNDADPTSTPNTWKLPSGDMNLNDYLDKLTEDSVSAGGTGQTQINY